MYRIGIDVGGTFTDLVAVDDAGTVKTAKVTSTPDDPSLGVMDGLRVLADALGCNLKGFLAATDRLVHGTTVATNALLERKGALVGLLTTDGHRDVLEMREGLKDDRYNLRMPPPVPIVPRALRMEVRERITFDGRIRIPLSQPSLLRAIERLRRAGVRAVAICYLHSYRDPRHEMTTQRMVARRMPDVYISTSSEVLPQIKEYERVCTTIVNAYVGPTLAHYLTNLAERLKAAGYQRDVLIMQSHGGVATVQDSVRLAAGAILSGPAGGIAGGRYSAALLKQGNLITFDMGGTSTDIALLEDGEPLLTGDKAISGVKVALPSLDIHTLGAGGGSIARVDEGRILHVGPESAGANPGPACYGRGGRVATVTDANVVLGYLDPKNFLGGRTPLDAGAAKRVVRLAADRLGGSDVTTAEGIYRVVNTNMAEGIRIVSVRRGIDPRRFSLLSFGGAAGLHISEVARMLEIARVVIPRAASVLSAWGMLTTDLRYEFVQTHVGEAHRIGARRLRRIFQRMEAAASARLSRAFSGPITFRRSLDMRYGEQIFEITVPLNDVDLNASELIDTIIDRFTRCHEALYTYSAPDQEVVVVNVRLAAVGQLPIAPVEPTVVNTGTPAPVGRRRAYLQGGWEEIPVYRWDALSTSVEIVGPAFFESDTTTVLACPADRVRVTPQGWLDVEIHLNGAGSDSTINLRRESGTASSLFRR